MSGSSQVQVWPRPHQCALLPHKTPQAAARLAAAAGHPATSSFRTPRQHGGRDALRGEPTAAAATSWLPGRPALAAGRAVLVPALFNSQWARRRLPAAERKVRPPRRQRGGAQSRGGTPPGDAFPLLPRGRLPGPRPVSHLASKGKATAPSSPAYLSPRITSRGPRREAGAAPLTAPRRRRGLRRGRGRAAAAGPPVPRPRRCPCPGGAGRRQRTLPARPPAGRSAGARWEVSSCE